ncbi:MAG: hypothetical protein OXE52_08785 [Chloroflexi bacterium]|nr:hypothetical protein [Chloroflexota bacterium]
MRAPKTKPANVQELETLPLCVERGDDGGETSKEEILDSIERGLQEMLAGNTRPALEFLDEFDNE